MLEKRLLCALHRHVDRRYGLKLSGLEGELTSLQSDLHSISTQLNEKDSQILSQRSLQSSESERHKSEISLL